MKLVAVLFLFSSIAFGAVTKTTLETATPDFGMDVQYGALGYYAYRIDSSSGPAGRGDSIRLASEYLIYDQFGKLGMGIGLGYFSQPNVSLGEDRYASIKTYPLETFVSYHLDYQQDQPLVPYLRMGPGVTWITQTSKTGAAVDGTRHNLSFFYAAGLQVCLNRVDKTAAGSLRNRFGIENTYLVGEYVGSTRLGPKETPNLDLGGYRLGLRLEM